MLTIAHDFPFDPRYGYTHDDLRQLGAPDTAPSDFAAFWQDLYQETLAIELNLERQESPLTAQGWRVEVLYFDTLNQRRIGAWLVTPDHGQVRSLRVVGHGYGGRSEPSLSPADLRKQTAHFFPVAPGFHISAADDIPLNDAGKHVVHGIHDKNSYVFRECIASLWSMATVAIALFPELAQTLHYIGWSYGGGVGTLMLPWDQRYVCAELGQPSFGHHPLRLQCQCVGSGEAVRAYQKTHPEVTAVLAYFDAATAATYIQKPTLFAVCAFDPAVPPPGQYATAGSCPAHERQISEIEVGHYDADYPGKIQQGTAHMRKRRAFFDQYAALL